MAHIQVLTSAPLIKELGVIISNEGTTQYAFWLHRNPCNMPRYSDVALFTSVVSSVIDAWDDRM